MRWLMETWHRLLVRAAPPRAPLERDPDLDAVHREQHDLMNRSGYAGQRVRDSWNERVRESWRAGGAR